MKALYIKISRAIQFTALLLMLNACGGGSSPSSNGGVGNTGGGGSTPTTYTVGGTITGLVSTGLVLQNNSSDNLTVASAATTFTFATALTGGAAYSITVLTQPNNPAETCSVTNSSGTVGAANVTNIAVACIAQIVTPPSTTQNSFDLIDQALASGAIDYETALTYKIFATFADSRLPSQYQGNNDGITDTPAMDELATNFNTLSEATQELLAPFLMRPNLQGSWTDTSTAASTTSSSALRMKNAKATPAFTRPPCQLLSSDIWAYEERAGTPVRVWYLAADHATAIALADEMQNTIWPAFLTWIKGSANMPLDDTNTGDDICFGGDGQLDVYLTDLGDEGLTSSDGFAFFPTQAAVFIQLRRSLPINTLKAVMTHELMHAVQWANPTQVNQMSYGWIRDAMANWAIDMVYGKTNQYEQTRAACFLENQTLSLDDRTTASCGFARDYGAYLYFQFLANTTAAGKGIAAQALKAMGGTDTGVKALDGLYPFKDQWPIFAKLLWNQDPDNVKSGLDSFKIWDALTLNPTPKTGSTPVTIDLAGLPGKTVTLEGNIKHLATHYFQFTITDPNVRSLSITNHPYVVTPSADHLVATQIFFKLQGQNWDYANWSNPGDTDAIKSYCLDVTAERLEQFVIVMSNNHTEKDIVDIASLEQPRLSVSNVGCWQYKGTTSIVDNSTTTDSTTGKTTSSVALNDSTTDVTFQNTRYKTSPPQPVQTPAEAKYEVIGGTVTGHGVQILNLSSCTITTDIKDTATNSSSAAIPVATSSGSLTVELGLDIGTGTTLRTVSGSGESNEPTHTNETCSGVSLVDNDGQDSWSWLEFPQPNEQPVVVKPDGTIQGTFDHVYTTPYSGKRTMTWTLTPQRQP